MGTVYRFRMDDHGRTFFSVYDGVELVADVAYRNGEEEVKQRLYHFQKRKNDERDRKDQSRGEAEGVSSY